MASGRKSRGDPRRKPLNLAQFGIPDIPNMNYTGSMDSDEDDDNDLESELEALMSGKPKPKPSRTPRKAMNVADVEKMAQQCMEEEEDDDVNVSEDETLLEELSALTSDTSSDEPKGHSLHPVEHPTHSKDFAASTIDVLTERLKLYKEAVNASKLCGENSKVRRYERAVKSLEELLKSAKSGNTISEADIPPLVTIPKPKPEDMPASKPDAVKSSPMLKEDSGTPFSADVTILPSRPAPRAPSIHTQNFPSQHGSAFPGSVPVLPPRPSPVSSHNFSQLSPDLLSDVMSSSDGQLLPPKAVPMVPQSDKQSSKNSNANSMNYLLKTRRDQYKLAALKAKRSGDKETAIKFVKIAKKFDAVIEAEERGQPVDLTNMPPPPPAALIARAPVSGNAAAVPKIPEPNPTVLSAENTSNTSDGFAATALAAADEPMDPAFFNAPPPPATILEALQQRLGKFTSTRDAAKEEGNNSKFRRLQRIVKQYEEAIKSYKAGKEVDFEELPAPPGYGPIPVSSVISVPPPPPKVDVPPLAETESQKTTSQGPKAVEQHGGAPDSREPSTKKHPKLQRANTSSILDKQLKFLLERQKLFREAALESKKKGDVQQAIEYLRMSKGFDSMITATKSGLPIDATSIPTPPQLESDYEIVDISECTEGTANGMEGLFANLEKELHSQIEMCSRNKDHFLSLGDVSSASKYNHFSNFCQLINHYHRNKVFSLREHNSEIKHYKFMF